MKVLLINFTVLLTFLISSIAIAAPTASELVNLADEIARKVDRNAYSLGPRQRRKLHASLIEVRRTIRYLKSGKVNKPPKLKPPKNKPPKKYRPYPTLNGYVATCHVDDDPNFDWNQKIIGQVTGTNVDDLISDCKAIADSMYGSNSFGPRGSSGIKDLQAQGQSYGMRSAECWVDDDPSFDPGQDLIGIVVGPSVTDLINQCSLIANSIYGSNSFGPRGSSGLDKLK